MTRWSVDPEGVRGVLVGVEDVAGGLVDALGGVVGVVDPLVVGAGDGLGSVVEAVVAYFDREAPEMSGMPVRVAAAVSGCVAATNAYVVGDEEMAGNAVVEAGKAALSGDLGYFGVDHSRLGLSGE